MNECHALTLHPFNNMDLNEKSFELSTKPDEHLEQWSLFWRAQSESACPQIVIKLTERKSFV